MYKHTQKTHTMTSTPPQSPKKPVCPPAPRKKFVVPEAAYSSWQHFSRKIQVECDNIISQKPIV